VQQSRQCSTAPALDFLPRSQLSDLYDLLQTWKQAESEPDRPGWREQIPFFNQNRQPENIADLITLGDYWLAPAIRQELIQPLQLEDLPEWQKLPARWQDLVRRDRQGQLTGGTLGRPLSLEQCRHCLPG
jgi:putative spermidine/putrescine transport system substrate-binding protein